MAMRGTDSFLYLIATVGLVIAAILTSAIINATRDKQASPTDIRARAGATNTLKLIGTVSSVDEVQRALMVDDVQFAQESISGAPKNLGTWTVTPPFQFSLGTAYPGASVQFAVDAKTFDVASRSVVATEVIIIR